MTDMLSGKKAALLVATGFEQSELVEPRIALEQAGARADIVSLKKDAVRAWNHHDWGDEFDVDRHIDEVSVEDYDALILPGGVMNPDFLRMDLRAVRLVGEFYVSGKPLAAICHGPWLLVEADVVRGRRVTSYPSLRTDLRNALARWYDEPVVVDGNLITARRPDDLPLFCSTLVEAISRPAGPHEPRDLDDATFAE